MNPRQRRGIVLILISVVVAAFTFVAVTRYVANINSQVGSRVTVYRAATAVPPYTPLTKKNLEPVEVPRRWVSESSVVSMNDLLGRRIGFRVNPGTTLSSDMLLPSTSLNRNEREVAINVDAVTGVAGRVKPGNRVDVYAVFGDVSGLPKTARTICKGVRIVSIAGTQQVTEETGEGAQENTVLPVTLALTPKNALAVTYAAQFADEVRLVALPTDVGVDRKGEPSSYNAKNLGGKPVAEGK